MMIRTKICLWLALGMLFLVCVCRSGLYGITANTGYSIKEAALGRQDSWPMFSSSYFTVYYDPEVQLKTVSRRLHRRMFYVNGYKRQVYLGTTEGKIGSRLDMLMERVEEILGIYVSNVEVKVKLFKTRRDLNEEFYRIFKLRKDVKSFYIHKHNTIYISEENVTDSVMAHEIGHVVVDNYFKVVPPEKTREVLATYVDLHLD